MTPEERTRLLGELERLYFTYHARARAADPTSIAGSIYGRMLASIVEWRKTVTDLEPPYAPNY